MDRYERQEESESVRWDELAEIALTRFGELQRGESISAREIRNRLSRLREAGYDVSTKGKKDELWQELQKARERIRVEVGKYYPATLRNIDRRNQAQQYNRSL